MAMSFMEREAIISEMMPESKSFLVYEAESPHQAVRIYTCSRCGCAVTDRLNHWAFHEVTGGADSGQ